MEPADAPAATLALLAGRADGATICPSEVARAIAAEAGHADWRGEMAAVHSAVDGLAAQGQVRLSWKGREMPVRQGPYRIGRPPPPPEG
ncbi:MAG TPA: DUF3253 domain-containing protein [Allosphingosinicella sp.]|jgi:hypothetical protein